ncbi:transglutaminase [Sphaerisporangium krabiense]|uniref:Transglutaminase-like putative cysteine protease n=1 Tax=Sphaerisporangium krabiense TaxID=763782 RepID=A0A7W8Z8D3_9ACTN|nr:DUF3488 and transglutaminase-like domain-containing protein [Sphaerisporangium krabiense]MBB5629282.1 transglutaminase-like putative cysteine protease [Sphaerisporangium krabiense]GII67056.1 transglutaminase [Sphaerisporangium krabiense]
MRLPIAAALATAAVSLTLYPLFREGDWFWTGMGAILVVGAVSVLTTRPAVPRWLGPPLGLLMLGLYLNMVFAADHSWGRVVPTAESLVALAGLLGEGFADIQRYAAPVPANPGITLLTAGGVGLIALAVDLLAVRLRRAAPAGLPLLALFTVPAAVMTEPLGWPAFILGALGYVGLLAADGRERLSTWGRAVLVRRTRAAAATAKPDSTPISLSGKRIGIAAIALAVGVPALMPTLAPNPLFGFGVGSGTGAGGNTIEIPDPIANLRGRLTQPGNATVLTYTNSDNTARYLRMYSLDIFDGRRWTMSQPKGRPENSVAEGALPAPPGLAPDVPVKQVTTRLKVSDAVEGLSFLPLPYPATTVQVDGDWRADESTLMVFSTRDTAGGQEYEVGQREPRPTPELLADLAASPDPEVDARYLRLPDDMPPEITLTAHGLVADTDSPYEAAVKLQNWFTNTGGFTYSLRTQGNGSDALVDFLRNKTGYCEQFAAAMAVMARVLGVPARVAIGYTGGTFSDGVWQVRTHDLHAWPELYFEGAGWLRFEPTPSGGLGQATARVPDYSRPPVTTGGPDSTSTAPTAGPESGDPETSSAPRRAVRDPDANLPQGSVDAETGSPVPAMIGIGLAVLLLILLVPAAWRAATRYRREHVRARAGSGVTAAGVPMVTGGGAEVSSGDGRVARAVHGTWRELIDTLHDLGLGYELSETPRALARRLAERHELDADAAAAVARIASAEERLRYARTPGEIPPLTADLRVVRRALRRAVPRGRRLRATLMPASTLMRVRRAGAAMLDGFDRLENIRLWPRRRHQDAAGGPEPAEETRVLTGSRR